MKLDFKTIATTLLIGILTFIAGKVWEGVEIAKENRTHREMQAEDIQEIKADLKELRKELYGIYPVINEVAEAADVGTGAE